MIVKVPQIWNQHYLLQYIYGLVLVHGIVFVCYTGVFRIPVLECGIIILLNHHIVFCVLFCNLYFTVIIITFLQSRF